MDVLDKFLRKVSYKFPKGYPDINDAQDMLMLEGMLKEMGIELNELVKLDYEVLTPEAKKVAEKIMDEFGITKDQIKPTTKTHIVIYTDDRDSLYPQFDRSGNYGPNLLANKGKYKVDGITITLKPTGAKAGEFFELKPQQLGISLDKKITLEQLKSELIKGIQSNPVLNNAQKEVLLYAVNKTGDFPTKSRDEAFQEKGFSNEVNKNFGEPHGALIYGTQTEQDAVEFPSAGNYRLLDYILYKGDEQTQVSAKAGKSVGNTVKYEDVIKLVDRAGGDVPDPLRTLSDVISNNSVTTGAFEAIKELGFTDLEKEVEEYKKKYPQYPKLGKRPEDEESHRDRIAIEKELVRRINQDPRFDFNELFNNYVAVKYVKYYLDPETLDGVINVIDAGNFKVSHLTKNSPNHDSDKLGLSVRKLK